MAGFDLKEIERRMRGALDRAQAGVRRLAHRPRQYEPARSDHGKCLWQPNAAQSARHHQRAGIEADHRAGVGPVTGRRRGARHPRIRSRAEPGGRRTAAAPADPGAERGAAPRDREGRAQIYRAGARRRAQRSPRRHGAPEAHGEGRRHRQGRAPFDVHQGAGIDRQDHQGDRRGACRARKPRSCRSSRRDGAKSNNACSLLLEH